MALIVILCAFCRSAMSCAVEPRFTSNGTSNGSNKRYILDSLDYLGVRFVRPCSALRLDL